MRTLKTSLTHIRRTPYQATAAIILSSIAFIIVSVFTLLGIGTSRTLSYLESKPQVTAFFHDDTTEQEVASLRRELEATNTTEEIVYISKEEALEIYRQQNQENPLLLEMVTADILPASLEASAISVDNLEGIAKIMQDNNNVEEVIYQKDIVDSLKIWIRGIKTAGIALSAVFLFASIMTITVIVGLKTASRKLEIDTLSLLGASTWYIKGPFIMEGIIYSVSGAFIGWGITYLALLYLTPNLIDFLQGIPFLPVSTLTMLAVLGSQILLGTFIGIVASLMATKRYGR